MHQAEDMLMDTGAVMPIYYYNDIFMLNDKDVIQDEEIKVFVDELADSSVVIGLRAWVKTEAYWTTRWRVLEEIKLQFDEAGIEIPFNQLTVHMKEGK